MANPHVEQIRSAGEPARQYMWEVLIPGSLPGAGGSGGGDNTQFTYRAMSTTIPDKVLEAYEHMFKSTKVSFAGKDASGKTLDLTFFDATDMFVYKSMFNWNDYCLTNKKEDYILDALELNLLDRQDEEILKCKLIAVWPENVQALNLDYGTNDPVNVVVTLRYDDSELE